MSKKIYITIEDGIDDVTAIESVLKVVRKGRISKNGKLYCYLTLFSNGLAVNTRDYRKHDCFSVYKDSKRTF